MSDLKISSYDFLAIFCPGILLLLPLIINLDYTTKCEWIIVFLFLSVSYFVGLAFHNLIEFLLKAVGILKNKYLLVNTYQCVNKQQPAKDKIRQIYNKQYYSIMKSGMIGNIPILESQEAFIRNFSISAIISLLIFNEYLNQVIKPDSCCAYLICSIFIPLSIILWINTQRKIFIAVWDTYKHCREKNDVAMLSIDKM